MRVSIMKNTINKHINKLMNKHVKKNTGKICTFRTDRRGFSLIELIIVVTIIGVFAGIAVPTFLHHLEESKVETDRDTLHTIYNCLVYQYALAASTPTSLDKNGSDDISSDSGLWGNGDIILAVDSKGYASLVHTQNFEKGAFLYDALSSAGLDVTTLGSGGKVPLFHSKIVTSAIAAGGANIMMAIDDDNLVHVWIGGQNSSGSNYSSNALPDARFSFG